MMKRVNRCPLRARMLVAGLLCCLLGSLAQWAVAEEPRRRALLIGVNEYASPKVNNLRGAVNDVLMLKRVLITRMAFPEQNIRVLTDGQATRAAILDALEDFVADTRKGDVVYIHYSGHGSRARDKNGDESDGFDETILPSDARQPGIPDIRDDELDRLFARLPTEQALIVFDSCHSGTVTRSVSTVQPRSVPADLRDDLYPAELATRQVVEVSQLQHVLMTGAPAEDEALDGPVDNGYYGLFSYSLAKALDKWGPNATAAQVHASVREELRRIQEQLSFSPPEPQLEADAARLDVPLLPLSRAGNPGQAVVVGMPASADAPAPAIVGAEPEPARRAWLAVQAEAGGRLRLLEGSTLNARPGSRWGIYGPGETAFPPGGALAQGTVVATSGRDALLQIDSRQGEIPVGARAIAVAPPDVSADMPVLISGVAAKRARALAALLQSRVPGFRAVGEGEFARFLVRYEQGQWQLYDAGGLQKIQALADGEDRQVAEKLAQQFLRSATALSLLALDNPVSDIKLQVGVRTASSPSLPESRGLVKVSEPARPAYRIRRGGQPRSHNNSLMIEVQSDRPVYLTVADVDTEGAITLLFPNGYQNPEFLPQGYVPADTLVRIPDRLESGNQAGFYWDYAPPVGRDTLRVFASADLATAETIRQYIANASKDKSSLPQLGNRLASINTRGIKVVADDGGAAAQSGVQTGGETAGSPPGDWTARSLVLQIQD